MKTDKYLGVKNGHRRVLDGKANKTYQMWKIVWNHAS